MMTIRSTKITPEKIMIVMAILFVKRLLDGGITGTGVSGDVGGVGAGGGVESAIDLS